MRRRFDVCPTIRHKFAYHLFPCVVQTLIESFVLSDNLRSFTLMGTNAPSLPLETITFVTQSSTRKGHHRSSWNLVTLRFKIMDHFIGFLLCITNHIFNNLVGNLIQHIGERQNSLFRLQTLIRQCCEIVHFVLPRVHGEKCRARQHRMKLRKLPLEILAPIL